VRDLCGFTTTHTHNQHKTYTPHQQHTAPQPPYTATHHHQPANHAHQVEPSQPRAPVLFRRMRPGASSGLHLGQRQQQASKPASQQASKPASEQASKRQWATLARQQATMGNASTSAETRDTSASKPANKPRHRSASPPNTASPALSGIR